MIICSILSKIRVTLITSEHNNTLFATIWYMYKSKDLEKKWKLQGKFYCIHEKDKTSLKTILFPMWFFSFFSLFFFFFSLHISIAYFVYFGILGEPHWLCQIGIGEENKKNMKGQRQANCLSNHLIIGEWKKVKSKGNYIPCVPVSIPVRTPHCQGRCAIKNIIWVSSLIIQYSFSTLSKLHWKIYIMCA